MCNNKSLIQIEDLEDQKLFLHSKPVYVLECGVLNGPQSHFTLPFEYQAPILSSI